MVKIEIFEYLNELKNNETPSPEVISNAKILIEKVCNLLQEIGVPKVGVTSGWRSQAYNKKIGGARKSNHITGQAIDLSDYSGVLKKKITATLLEKYDLYMEAPISTPTWVHLQTVKTASGKRIFMP